MSTQLKGMSIEQVNAQIATSGRMSAACADFLFWLQGDRIGDLVPGVVYEDVPQAVSDLRKIEESHPYIINDPIYLAVSILIQWHEHTIVRYTSRLREGEIVLLPDTPSLYTQVGNLNVGNANGQTPRFVTRAPNIDKFGVWDKGRYDGELWYGRVALDRHPDVFVPQGPFQWVAIEGHRHGGEWRDPYVNG